MPLYKSIVTPGGETRVLVWKISEGENELYRSVRLKDVCLARMEGMKSEQHRRGFLSVRMLLQEAGYTDFDLYYGTDGKPHLTDGKHISITHSYGFSAIVISSRNVGIDMELRREKVITIADKFVEKEFAYLDPMHLELYMKMLIIIWGVKEAVFKMVSREGISFKQHIEIFPFDAESGFGQAALRFEDIERLYDFFFEQIEDFTLVYSLEANTNE